MILVKWKICIENVKQIIEMINQYHFESRDSEIPTTRRKIIKNKNNDYYSLAHTGLIPI